MKFFATNKVILSGSTTDTDFFYVIKTSSDMFILIEINSEREIAEDTDYLEHPAKVLNKTDFIKFSDNLIEQGHMVKEELEKFLTQAGIVSIKSTEV